jgi:hypothetical protein
LPVGFARHYDPNTQDEMLDITCAACHTGQLNVTRNGKMTAIRIDGGEARHALTDMGFGNFLPELILALGETWLDPFTFERFGRKVLAENYDESKGKLRADLYEVVGNSSNRARSI